MNRAEAGVLERTVAVVGLGLIGGSMARDLAQRGVRVRGYDRDEGTLRAVREAGIPCERVGDGHPDLSDVDVVILATPVDEAQSILAGTGLQTTRARLVMDVGSTKVGVLRSAALAGLGDRFVGSHPLAGDHRHGWEASRTGLFDGSRVFLCASTEATPAALLLASQVWRTLGARPERLDAETHDERLAWSSHMPQAVSLALALALQQAGVRRSDLGPGGRDMTRLAGSSADVWTPILCENAKAIAEAMACVEHALACLRQQLASGTPDGASLRQQLEAAQGWSIGAATTAASEAGP